jgi:PIN domain nuclease of toxin-antitoxin system
MNVLLDTCACTAPIHRDLFDRVLVGLAQAHALPVLTSDQDIANPGVCEDTLVIRRS